MYCALSAPQAVLQQIPELLGACSGSGEAEGIAVLAVEAAHLRALPERESHYSHRRYSYKKLR